MPISRRVRTLIAATSFALAIPILCATTAAAGDRVEVAGGSGPDVLLIPDLAADGGSLQPIAAYLAKCHRTHTFTLAGFAGQPAGSAPRLDGWEKAIADYIASLDGHRAIVIGHGLGGVLGLKVASAQPHALSQLVVLNALPFPAAMVNVARDPAKVTRQSILAQSPDAFAADERQLLAAMTTHAESLPQLVGWSAASDRRVIADAYDELRTTDLREVIAAVSAPTLVLVAWDTSQPLDTATTLDLYRKQYQMLAGAQVKPIKGSRHFMTLDQPIATNWAIEEFIGKCESAMR